ncbi:methyltransferase domain-containing protein [Candidatus Poribacteria bacterium]|nr:methyltransferase domain-containing protein [Candidatus Poribacteria bacterium]
MKYKGLLALVGGLLIIGSLCLAEPLLVPSPEEYTLEYAVNFQKTANTTLAPVYAPLAQQITEDFKLHDKRGIGVDLGSGPGNLIVELCKVTQNMHWVNADINPFFFPIFYKAAEEAEFGHRVSAIFADSQALPFRDNYADIVVSRGSFHFWDDEEKAFGEIYRVLKPEGTAFIGRGFSRNMPVEIAKAVRSRQGKGKGGMPKYSVSDTADELKGIMESLNIEDYRIHTPTPPDSDGVNYGIWLEFHKK